MLKASLPFDEKQRHEELLRYKILDTPPENDFNDLIEVASILCNTKSASITFIDTNRQWLKAAKNIDAIESNRDMSICGHAILKDDILLIKDTLEDERFKDNPNVIAGPKIRFYAGAPIFTSTGKKIGVLCVVDKVPNKKLTGKQISALQLLSKQVSKLLELRLFNAETIKKSTELIIAEKAIAQLNLLLNESKNDEIAYELHENIAQLIAATKIKVESIQNLKSFSSEEISEVKDYLGMILKDVKKLSNSVTPTTFKGSDYIDYVEEMLNRFKKNYNINFNFAQQGQNLKFNAKVGLALYRIIQYQLYFAKLTEANQINIQLNNNENSTLVFEYNGKLELCDSLDADLYLNNINTYATSIKATFKNDAAAKSMTVTFQTNSPEAVDSSALSV
jgi:hypothetical protein